METVVQEDRRRTVKSIAMTLDMSYGSVYDILHDTLGYRKVAARWVPRSLTEDNKADRMMTCLDHLATYRNDGTTFLDNIVTGDETWVHHFIPESKQARQHFGNDDEVKETVRQWLRCQPDSFFRLGIENLVVRWDKCLNTLGDYVEK